MNNQEAVGKSSDQTTTYSNDNEHHQLLLAVEKRKILIKNQLKRHLYPKTASVKLKKSEFLLGDQSCSEETRRNDIALAVSRRINSIGYMLQKKKHTHKVKRHQHKDLTILPNEQNNKVLRHVNNFHTPSSNEKYQIRNEKYDLNKENMCRQKGYQKDNLKNTSSAKDTPKEYRAIATTPANLCSNSSTKVAQAKPPNTTQERMKKYSDVDFDVDNFLEHYMEGKKSYSTSKHVSFAGTMPDSSSIGKQVLSDFRTMPTASFGEARSNFSGELNLNTIRRLFNDLDKDKDGLLTPTEVSIAMQRLHIPVSWKVINTLFDRIPVGQTKEPQKRVINQKIFSSFVAAATTRVKHKSSGSKKTIIQISKEAEMCSENTTAEFSSKNISHILNETLDQATKSDDVNSSQSSVCESVSIDHQPQLYDPAKSLEMSLMKELPQQILCRALIQKELMEKAKSECKDTPKIEGMIKKKMEQQLVQDLSREILKDHLNATEQKNTVENTGLEKAKVFFDSDELRWKLNYSPFDQEAFLNSKILNFVLQHYLKYLSNNDAEPNDKSFEKEKTEVFPLSTDSKKDVDQVECNSNLTRAIDVLKNSNTEDEKFMRTEISDDMVHLASAPDIKEYNEIENKNFSHIGSFFVFEDRNDIPTDVAIENKTRTADAYNFLNCFNRLRSERKKKQKANIDVGKSSNSVLDSSLVSSHNFLIIESSKNIPHMDMGDSGSSGPNFAGPEIATVSVNEMINKSKLQDHQINYEFDDSSSSVHSSEGSSSEESSDQYYSGGEVSNSSSVSEGELEYDHKAFEELASVPSPVYYARSCHSDDSCSTDSGQVLSFNVVSGTGQIEIGEAISSSTYGDEGSDLDSSIESGEFETQ